MTHRLQTLFATLEGEESYSHALQALVEAGSLDAVEEILVDDLAALDTDLARMCLETRRDKVLLSGWEELYEAIEVQEGEPVTGVAIGMGNEADLAFEKGLQHTPFLTLGIYCDGDFPWSQATRESIIAQCALPEPAWVGSDEDIEVYLEIEGLTAINTALLHHKHRFFLRDGDPQTAPRAYVEYVLASWLRALRFHQAVGAQMAEHGLPGEVRVLSGLVDMRPGVASVHMPAQAAAQARIVEPRAEPDEEGEEPDEIEIATFAVASEAPGMGQLTDVAWKSVPFEEEKVVTGSDIRRQISRPVAEPVRRGFFSRLFGRKAA